MLRMNKIFTVLMLAALLIGACQPLMNPTAGVPETPRPDAPTYGVRGPYTVGTQEIVVEPDSARPLTVTVWYPAVKEANVEELTTYAAQYPPVFENYVVAGRAIRDAAFDMTMAPYPLVVFSTGLNASRLVAVNYTEHLASYGFVVMAPDHPGTTPVDAAGDGEYWPMYVERPQDIQRVITYAEAATAADGLFAGLIDPELTAVTGVSSGSLGAFAAGSAQLDLARCLDPNEEFECSQIRGHEAELAALAGLETAPEGLWPPIFTESVDAIIPIVPDYGLYGIDDVGVAGVEIPTLILGAGGDTVNPIEQGAVPFYARIGSEHKGLVILENAWHVFLVNACPANPWMATDAGWGHWFCSDPVWDMQRAHDIANHFVTAFLLAELYGDAEAAAALAPENVAITGVQYETTGFGE
ncbi:MAG: hypothetical protein R3A44_24225 [Caldilineaceae bacterium]